SWRPLVVKHFPTIRHPHAQLALSSARLVGTVVPAKMPDFEAGAALEGGVAPRGLVLEQRADFAALCLRFVLPSVLPLRLSSDRHVARRYTFTRLGRRKRLPG
ncbi:LOW QUALITY PROTEIN: Cation-transporting ATPase, partial [Phytophthora palmivora]